MMANFMQMLMGLAGQRGGPGGGAPGFRKPMQDDLSGRAYAGGSNTFNENALQSVNPNQYDMGLDDNARARMIMAQERPQAQPFGIFGRAEALNAARNPVYSNPGDATGARAIVDSMPTREGYGSSFAQPGAVPDQIASMPTRPGPGPSSAIGGSMDMMNLMNMMAQRGGMNRSTLGNG